jgi:hypothetical protein
VINYSSSEKAAHETVAAAENLGAKTLGGLLDPEGSGVDRDACFRHHDHDRDDGDHDDDGHWR